MNAESFSEFCVLIIIQLKALLQEDLYRILTEPENNQIRQQIELLKTEGITLQFNESAIQALARIAAEVNAQVFMCAKW